QPFEAASHDLRELSSVDCQQPASRDRGCIGGAWCAVEDSQFAEASAWTNDLQYDLASAGGQRGQFHIASQHSEHGPPGVATPEEMLALPQGAHRGSLHQFEKVPFGQAAECTLSGKQLVRNIIDTAMSLQPNGCGICCYCAWLM